MNCEENAIIFRLVRCWKPFGFYLPKKRTSEGTNERAREENKENQNNGENRENCGKWKYRNKMKTWSSHAPIQLNQPQTVFTSFSCSVVALRFVDFWYLFSFFHGLFLVQPILNYPDNQSWNLVCFCRDFCCRIITPIFQRIFIQYQTRLFDQNH